MQVFLLRNTFSAIKKWVWLIFAQQINTTDPGRTVGRSLDAALYQSEPSETQTRFQNIDDAYILHASGKCIKPNITGMNIE